MAGLKCTCPGCNLTFNASKAAPATITCPICDTSFAAPAAATPTWTAVPGPDLSPSPVSHLPKAPRPAPTGEHPASWPAPPPGRRKVVLALVLVGLLVYLGGGIFLAVYLLKGSKASEPPPDHSAALAASTVPPEKTEPAPPDPPAPPPLAPVPVPLTPQQIKVNQAIDLGVDFLKKQLSNLTENSVQFIQGNNNAVGVLSLLGLTLLECGVPENDPLLQETADLVRSQGPNQLQTYSVALAILFLDRLGKSSDDNLIHTLALRLIAGQTLAGNWTYGCHRLSEDEEKQLSGYLKSLTPTSASAKLRPVDPASLPNKLRNFPIVQMQRGKNNFKGATGDNSNTQFAVLALWVANRHGVPVRPALAAAEKYFRETQNSDGSWGYAPRGQQWRDSMTCAGLLGLAVGRGIESQVPRADKPEARGPAQDPGMEEGFQFLKKMIGSKGRGKIIGAEAHGDLYYLWSLERVAMVYDLKTIGGKNWYDWASEAIVGAQRGDGSWQDSCPQQIDTCFALLVLKRVNVAKDLTSNIKRLIKIKELEGASEPPLRGGPNPE